MLINMKSLYLFWGCHHSIIVTALADTAFATWSENRAPITSLKASPTNIEDFALYPTLLNVHDCGRCARRRSIQESRHTAPRKQACTAKTTQSTDIFLTMGQPIRLLRSHISWHNCCAADAQRLFTVFSCHALRNYDTYNGMRYWLQRFAHPMSQFPQEWLWREGVEYQAI